ncbi:MAG: hypothetical protein WC400_01015 [Patescibacteria group bacterium]
MSPSADGRVQRKAESYILSDEERERLAEDFGYFSRKSNRKNLGEQNGS